jgi:putative hydrolase
MSQSPYGDIPLFRELQKLLAASKGPVNYEIARQVAGAVAAQAGTEPPLAKEAHDYGAAVHSAEQMLAATTRLELDEPTRPQVITRAHWITTALDGWSWLFNRLAERFTGELTRMGEDLGAPEGAEANPMQQAMGQVGPLLLGLQTGQMVGQLSRETLGRYYFPIPFDDDGPPFFVLANGVSLANTYGFESGSFRRWLATQETARHLLFRRVPWLRRYFRSLFTELVDAIEIDTGDMERRLMELQSMGIESLQENRPDTAIPIVQTERHQRALARTRAVLALFEGYASHAAGAVLGVSRTSPAEREGKARDEAMARVVEGISRHRSSPSEGEQMLSTMLGISFDRALETSGETFCAAVMRLKGLDALNKVWDAADNLPSAEEIRDPFAWMERVLEP